MKMNAEQRELLNNILANKEFLAEILKAAKKPKEIPPLAIGDTVEIAEITWRKFKEDENGNSYMLADDSIDMMEFGETNDWRSSFAREKLADLAERIKEEIGDKLVPIETDLLSHDGLDTYGKCEDLVSLLTYDLYRNNRRNIKKIDKCWWLCTPYSTPEGIGSDDVCYVFSRGDVYYGWYDYDRGVRGFIILKSSNHKEEKA